MDCTAACSDSGVARAGGTAGPASSAILENNPRVNGFDMAGPYRRLNPDALKVLR